MTIKGALFIWPVLTIFSILTQSAASSRIPPATINAPTTFNPWEAKTLTAPVDSNAQLGNDVSGVMINSETMMVVAGAYRDNLRLSKGDAADIDRAGTAWVWFVRVKRWTTLAGPFRLKSLHPTGASTNDGNFGYRVLALKNGDVIVSAPKDTLNAINSGAVYRFSCATNGCTNIQTIIAQTFVGGVLTNTPVAGGNFGSSLSADGNWMAVGSSADMVALDVEGEVWWRACGSVFVYSLPEMALTQRLPYPHTLEGGTCGGNDFGTSVSLSGNFLLVGAENDGIVLLHSNGTSTLYRRTNGQYDMVTRVWGDDQGELPAGGKSGLVFNNGIFIHGTPNYSLTDGESELLNAGAFYVFETTSPYTQTQKVISDSPAQGGVFGSRLASSGDILTVCEPGAGKLHFMKFANGQFVSASSPIHEAGAFCSSVSWSENKVLIGNTSVNSGKGDVSIYSFSCPLPSISNPDGLCYHYIPQVLR